MIKNRIIALALCLSFLMTSVSPLSLAYGITDNIKNIEQVQSDVLEMAVSDSASDEDVNQKMETAFNFDSDESDSDNEESLDNSDSDDEESSDNSDSDDEESSDNSDSGDEETSVGSDSGDVVAISSEFKFSSERINPYWSCSSTYTLM